MPLCIRFLFEGRIRFVFSGIGTVGFFRRSDPDPVFIEGRIRVKSSRIRKPDLALLLLGVSGVPDSAYLGVPGFRGRSLYQFIH